MSRFLFFLGWTAMLESMAAAASTNAAMAVDLFLCGNDDGLAQANELATRRELTLIHTRLSVHQLATSLTSHGSRGLTFRNLALSSI